MMKRLLSGFIICPLIVIVLFVSGCSGDDTGYGSGDNSGGDSGASQTGQCLGEVTLEIVAAVVSGDPVTAYNVINTAIVCISDAIAAFSSPSNTGSSSPQVNIQTSPNDSVAITTATSNIASNCTDKAVPVQFTFSVSFVMYVGSPPDQSKYSSAPTGSSNNDLVAQKLFQQDQTDMLKNSTSLTIVQNVPPKTQMQLHLPIQISSKDGAAQVVNNGDTVVLPWIFTDGYQQAGSATPTMSPASKCS